MICRPYLDHSLGVGRDNEQAADDEDEANSPQAQTTPDVHKPWIVGKLSWVASLHSGVNGQEDQHPNGDEWNELNID